jgi:hypothetical protein
MFYRLLWLCLLLMGGVSLSAGPAPAAQPVVLQLTGLR